VIIISHLAPAGTKREQISVTRLVTYGAARTRISTLAEYASFELESTHNVSLIRSRFCERKTYFSTCIIFDAMR